RRRTPRTRSTASSTSSVACTRPRRRRRSRRGRGRVRRSCSTPKRSSRRTSATRISARTESHTRPSSRRATCTSSSRRKGRACAGGSGPPDSSAAAGTCSTRSSPRRRSWRSPAAGASRARSTSAACSARSTAARRASSGASRKRSRPDRRRRGGRLLSVLEATGISVSFGGVHAVVLVGLIGPNGAGKTTFIDAITGFVRYRGRVVLDGRDLTRLPPHARARLGLARTWQSIELFDDLSVRENLLVASHRPSVWRTIGETLSRPDAGTGEIGPALELLGLEEVADEMPTELSQGQRKLVGIARALATRPRLVCLDEPAAGLDTHESAELGRRLRVLADSGQAMLLVDHDMGLVLGICDEVTVLEFGKVIARGPAEAVRRDEAVITAYLGSAASELAGNGA